MTQAFSGRPLSELTVAAAVSGTLASDDIRIHPDTLRRQAEIADEQGNTQLGDNLRRAAELSHFADEDLLRMYDLLRPGRATLEQMHALEAELTERGATSCAALVRHAVDVYVRRGLIRS
jgi:propanediol dehydratase small subunit